MDSPREQKIYQGILRMVLWDEPREEVFQRLEVNGITGDQAETFYTAAMKERVTTIRVAYRSKAIQGFLWMAASVAAFCLLWFGVRVLPRIVLYACGVGLGMGLLRLCDGLSGMLLATHKRGSVADEL